MVCGPLPNTVYTCGPLAHQQGFAISRQSYSVKASDRGPRRTASWPRLGNRGLKALCLCLTEQGGDANCERPERSLQHCLPCNPARKCDECALTRKSTFCHFHLFGSDAQAPRIVSERRVCFQTSPCSGWRSILKPVEANVVARAPNAAALKRTRSPFRRRSTSSPAAGNDHVDLLSLICDRQRTHSCRSRSDRLEHCAINTELFFRLKPAVADLCVWV